MVNIKSICASLLLIFSFSFFAAAKSSGEILVTGNPSLTQSDADEIIRYY